MTGGEELDAPIEADPELPILEDVDAVWELARLRRTR